MRSKNAFTFQMPIYKLLYLQYQVDDSRDGKGPTAQHLLSQSSRRGNIGSLPTIRPQEQNFNLSVKV